LIRKSSAPFRRRRKKRENRRRRRRRRRRRKWVQSALKRRERKKHEERSHCDYTQSSFVKDHAVDSIDVADDGGNMLKTVQDKICHWWSWFPELAALQHTH